MDHTRKKMAAPRIRGRQTFDRAAAYCLALSAGMLMVLSLPMLVLSL
jgi:hypothetical protein